MIKITKDVLDKEHSKLWAEALKKWGNELSVPSSEISKINEIVRALYVVQLWQKNSAGSKSPVSFLNSYSVSEQAIQHTMALLGMVNHEEAQPAMVKPESRKSKWAKLEQWAKKNQGKEFTTDEIVENSDFSYQTTLKHISESPLFVKVKKGLWRISSAER